MRNEMKKREQEKDATDWFHQHKETLIKIERQLAGYC